MASQLDEALAQRVCAHAFNTLTFDKRETTNLFLDDRIYDTGEKIGPAHQKIVAQALSSE